MPIWTKPTTANVPWLEILRCSSTRSLVPGTPELSVAPCAITVVPEPRIVPPVQFNVAPEAIVNRPLVARLPFRVPVPEVSVIAPVPVTVAPLEVCTDNDVNDSAVFSTNCVLVRSATSPGNASVPFSVRSTEQQMGAPTLNVPAPVIDLPAGRMNAPPPVVTLLLAASRARVALAATVMFPSVVVALPAGGRSVRVLPVTVMVPVPPV